MNTSIVEEVRRLLIGRRTDYSLPGVFYHSPEVFAMELEAIFLRSWILAGHIDQLPLPGSYFTVEFGSESLIIARDKEQNVRAYFNVCRHRGCRIATQKSGQAGSWVCPYHSWIYELDGRLRSARGMCDLDCAEMSLRGCAVHIFEGFIFVNAGPVAKPFSEVSEAVLPIFAKHKMTTCKIAHQRCWRVAANWKLLIENFDECYHCSTIHPEYSAIVAHATAESSASGPALEELKEIIREWEAEARSGGFPVGWIETPPTSDHWSCRYPLRRGKKTLSVTGNLVAPLLGDFKDSDGGVSSFRLYPGSYIIAPCDYAVAVQFLPATELFTDVCLTWFVNSSAKSDHDFSVDDITALWTITTEQDNRIVELQQKGIGSQAYVPGLYALTEDYCEHFLEWYSLRLLSSIGEYSER